jgi:23S rRNA A1618 N6-methylase RlmF
MCNPPFYSEEGERNKLEWRSAEMTENESVREGGEKYFISKMIDDEDRGRQILLNTCLVGKASTYREFVEQILPKKL